MNYDVFVSYSRSDETFAIALKDILEKKGVRCWRDREGIGIAKWAGKIVEAIDSVSFIVLIFSSNAQNSENVLKELTLAAENHCTVIPVRIENVKPAGDFRYHLATPNIIDIFDNESGYLDEVSEQIKDLVTSSRKQRVADNISSEDITAKEKSLLEMFKMAYEDGHVSDAERNIINNFIVTTDGISIERAKELEEQFKKEKNISNIATAANIVQSTPAGADDVDWPTAGHTFIKSVKKNLDISLLPFKPTYVSDDEEIEEEKSEPEIEWAISDKHYFAVWLTGKRKDKVDVHWGLYSSNEKRDPLIRKTSDDLYEVPELLDQDDDVSIDGVKYLWNDEGLLGQEANERKLISEINNPDFIKHVVDNLVAFANKAWPVIQNNLVNG